MKIFDALSDPTRRMIVELLARRDYAAGEIADHFTISAPAISQHLKVLRDANVVTVRIDAQRRIYALNPASLEEVDAWLAQVRGFWSARLDALAAQLEAEDAAQHSQPAQAEGKMDG